MPDYNEIEDATQFETNDTSNAIPPIIKVIGVGGGGNNAANYLFNQGIDNVTFLVCNTDKQQLKDLSIKEKVLLGPNVTRGLGAGDDENKGREAALESMEDIRRQLKDETRMVFITAGMGGGTGTGAAPVVAQVAKEEGLLTVGIVTIPFFFEGQRKIYKALEGAKEMRKHVDTLLMINNERLHEIYPDLNMINAFMKADDTLANATRSISQIINTRGYINADFNDVYTTLHDSSTAVISTGEGEGEHRVTKAIENALNSPLLRNSDIRTSKRLLFYLYCNPNAENVVTMQEMNEITQFSASLSPNIGIKWGTCWDESLGEKVRMTILASGFDLTIDKGNDVIVFPGNNATNTSSGSDKKNKKIDMTSNDSSDNETKINIAIEQAYGPGKLKDHNREMAKAKYVVLDPVQFDNDNVIMAFTKTPAFLRSSREKEELRNMGTAKEDAKIAQSSVKQQEGSVRVTDDRSGSDSVNTIYF